MLLVVLLLLSLLLLVIVVVLVRRGTVHSDGVVRGEERGGIFVVVLSKHLLLYSSSGRPQLLLPEFLCVLHSISASEVNVLDVPLSACQVLVYAQPIPAPQNRHVRSVRSLPQALDHLLNLRVCPRAIYYPHGVLLRVQLLVVALPGEDAAEDRGGLARSGGRLDYAVGGRLKGAKYVHANLPLRFGQLGERPANLLVWRAEVCDELVVVSGKRHI